MKKTILSTVILLKALMFSTTSWAIHFFIVNRNTVEPLEISIQGKSDDSSSKINTIIKTAHSNSPSIIITGEENGTLLTLPSNKRALVTVPKSYYSLIIVGCYPDSNNYHLISSTNLKELDKKELLFG